MAAIEGRARAAARPGTANPVYFSARGQWGLSQINVSGKHLGEHLW